MRLLKFATRLVSNCHPSTLEQYSNKRQGSEKKGNEDDGALSTKVVSFHLLTAC
jgi:hypothetical protein